MRLFVQRQIARKNGGGCFRHPPPYMQLYSRLRIASVGRDDPGAPYERGAICSKVISLAHTACFMDREMRFFFASTSSTTTFTTSPTATASEGCRRNRLLLIWEICTSPS